MFAFGGGLDQSERCTSCGAPGSEVGQKLRETISKMPAFCRSFCNVVLKVVARLLVPESVVICLKSAAASRIFSTPSPVPVRIQSCAESPSVASHTSEIIATNRFMGNGSSNTYQQ